MAYLHSAFIENSPEAREWLESLGYSGLVFYQTKPFLYSSFSERANINRRWQEPWYATEDYELITDNKIVDCRGNFSLFKAVTALRDDSDYMQIFTDGEKMEVCAGVDFLKEDYTPSELEERKNLWHKATLEELIEHFKTKKV